MLVLLVWLLSLFGGVGFVGVVVVGVCVGVGDDFVAVGCYFLMLRFGVVLLLVFAQLLLC